MTHFLLRKPSTQDLLVVLQAWRVWLAGALLGALLGALIYAFSPPPYRAAAVVMVDFNVEESFGNESADRDSNYFLARESGKLVDLAWSDAVLVPLADEVNIPMQDLRGGVLQLGQPADGGWRFYANASTPEKAVAIAGAWARYFHQQAIAEAARSLTQYQVQVPLVTTGGETDQAEIFELLRENNFGIHPFVNISLAQVEGLPAARALPLGAYAAAGSVMGALALAFVLVFVGARDAKPSA